MNSSSKTILAAFLLSSWLLAQPITVPALGPRFKQTRERVNVLFQYRDGSYPALDPEINLFRPLPDLAVRPAAPKEILPSAQSGDADESLLNQALVSFKKGGGGIVIASGHAHLTFNQKIYKEGDYISVGVGNKLLRILISRITTNSVTLNLNDTEAVWRF